MDRCFLTGGSYSDSVPAGLHPIFRFQLPQSGSIPRLSSLPGSERQPGPGSGSVVPPVLPRLPAQSAGLGCVSPCVSPDTSLRYKCGCRDYRSRSGRVWQCVWTCAPPGSLSLCILYCSWCTCRVCLCCADAGGTVNLRAAWRISHSLDGSTCMVDLRCESCCVAEGDWAVWSTFDSRSRSRVSPRCGYGCVGPGS